MFDVAELIRGMLALAGYLTDGRSLLKPLSAEEERSAVEKMAEGDDRARTRLIEHNMRLVVHITKKYASSKIDSDDLISIGTIGLIKAVNTYSLSKGTAFATYAARCIENEILMAIRSTKKLNGEVSLDEPIGHDAEGNEISLMDILDADASAVPDQVDMKIRCERLFESIEKELTPRERIVIKLRYGIDCEPTTQREVAQKLNISRSYVSRIEKRAVEKLSAALPQ